MRIGIEGQRLLRVNKHGMDMVALELIRNLREIDQVNEYVVFVKPDEDNALLQDTPNCKIVRLEGPSYPLWEQVVLPRAAMKHGCDILHCTSNTAPVHLDIPLIITLHDIIYMESSVKGIFRGSGSSYQKFGNLYRRFVVPRVLKKSRKIITVSEFEKDRIGDFFGITGDPRLTSVYNGVSEHFKPIKNEWVLNQAKDKYRLPDDFFFFLGNTDPKKNTKGTLRAFSDYLKLTGKNTHLVMLDFDREELSGILNEIGDPALIERISLTGYVKNTDLPAIYSLCKVFLYPSLRESFGIPILEAMACGAPVITSTTSSMPEIAGNAAILVDPFIPTRITEAMIQLTEDDDLAANYSEMGMARAANFTWRTMSLKVLERYHEVYAETHRS
ncbi:MAG TPA: glycosyltransferase family 1 protein [Bacteroidales bacterium]|nr:glycosyltransferase family 1 protein [Bacteroidales bacterium]